MSLKLYYQYCVVPLCKNNTKRTPTKLFIPVPHKPELRKIWLDLARKDWTNLSPNTTMYFCEDHFDLPNDMQNYIQYIVKGYIKKIRMKQGCLPSKFDCQPDRKRTALNIAPTDGNKKRRKELIEEALKEYETKITEMSEVSDSETKRTNQTKRGNSNIETPHPENIISQAGDGDQTDLEETDTGDETTLTVSQFDIKCEPLDSYSYEHHNGIEYTEIQSLCESVNTELCWSNNQKETEIHNRETVKKNSSVIEARMELLRVQTQVAHAELKLKNDTIEQQELEHRTRMDYLKRQGELKIKLLEEQLQIKNKTRTRRP